MARNILPLVHFSAVLCELVLAREAIAFSVVLTSDHRAHKHGGIRAVPGGSVADEVRPTLRVEAAMLDSAEEGFGISGTLPVMGLLMHSTFLCDPKALARWLNPFVSGGKPATIQMTKSVFMPCFVKDTYSKTHHAGTFLGGAYAR